jgi:predicted choloylglycine hydrolase
MDLACVPHIKRMMDLCNKKGIEMVVRVIPDPHKDIGLNILSLFHYRRRVHIVTCKTLEEAVKVLAG